MPKQVVINPVTQRPRRERRKSGWRALDDAKDAAAAEQEQIKATPPPSDDDNEQDTIATLGKAKPTQPWKKGKLASKIIKKKKRAARKLPPTESCTEPLLTQPPEPSSPPGIKPPPIQTTSIPSRSKSKSASKPPAKSLPTNQKLLQKISKSRLLDHMPKSLCRHRCSSRSHPQQTLLQPPQQHATTHTNHL